MATGAAASPQEQASASDIVRMKDVIKFSTGCRCPNNQCTFHHLTKYYCPSSQVTLQYILLSLDIEWVLFDSRVTLLEDLHILEERTCELLCCFTITIDKIKDILQAKLAIKKLNDLIAKFSEWGDRNRERIVRLGEHEVFKQFLGETINCLYTASLELFLKVISSSDCDQNTLRVGEECQLLLEKYNKKVDKYFCDSDRRFHCTTQTTSYECIVIDPEWDKFGIPATTESQVKVIDRIARALKLNEPSNHICLCNIYKREMMINFDTITSAEEYDYHRINEERFDYDKQQQQSDTVARSIKSFNN